MKKLFLIPAVIALFILPVLLFGQAPVNDVTIKKSGNKKGAVTYSHAKHAKIAIAKDCESCHKAAKSMKTAHKLCITCHKKEKAGPVKCNDCHKK